MYIWRFPEIGVPPVIIHFYMGFSLINHPAMGGTPIFGNHHIYIRRFWKYHMWLLPVPKIDPKLVPHFHLRFLLPMNRAHWSGKKW